MEISAVIITLNEEKRLARALESLCAPPAIANEILVVDSGSTDRTVEIAARYKARVIEHPWEGYARQKNFAASMAKHDWILSLDADEVLSEPLRESILRLKKEGTGQQAGFTVPRAAFYLGRWICHSGWYPDFKLRLYDRERCQWVGDYVHEHVEASGEVETLEGNLEHFTCDSFEDHLRSLDRYTTLAAEEAFERGTGRSAVSMLAAMLAGPPWKFFETYFLRQGFRDGFQGLVIAVMAGFYIFLKYAKLWQMSSGDRE